jgi:hypothetical protein
MSTANKPARRITGGEKGEKGARTESQLDKNTDSKVGGKGSATMNLNDGDEYEKGKKSKGGTSDELNADRKAVEDLDRWGS